MSNMETVHNLANAASKAIWGDSQTHEEPVSGKMGNVAAGEPYDAGNIGEENNEPAVSSSEDRYTERQATDTPINTALPVHGVKSAGTTSAAEPISTAVPSAENAPSAAAHTTIPTTITQEDKDRPTTETTTTTSRSTDQPSDAAGPAKDAPSAVNMRDDSTKAQNDTRPPADMSSSSNVDQQPKSRFTENLDTENKDTTIATENKPESTAAAKETTGDSDEAQAQAEATNDAGKSADDDNKDNKDATVKKSDNDNDNPEVKVEGPGPRPVAEVAREHGGDAGNVQEGEGGAGEGGAEGNRRRDSGKGLGGGEGEEEEDGPQKKSTGEGTGEEYVRSSGLKADGGDFDASRPGAGREADRLLEEKGVHHGPPDNKHKDSDSSSPAGGHKEKLGLKDKIKAKLHKNTMSS